MKKLLRQLDVVRKAIAETERIIGNRKFQNLDEYIKDNVREDYQGLLNEKQNIWNKIIELI